MTPEVTPTLTPHTLVTSADVGLAYRKAKVDLYYSSLPPLLRVANYEAKLAEKLSALQGRINSGDTSWIETDDFLNGDMWAGRCWTLVPKSISEPPKSDTLVCSSPWETWQAQHADGSRSKASFRLMADVSMDFQVLSALWMQQVGHKLEKSLTDHAYGSRLRRTSKGEISRLALGSFRPYLKPFRDWRDGGIQAMRTALAADKKVVALTADVSSFYHALAPDFLLNPAFLKVLGVLLSDSEQALHALFVQALKTWAAHTPLGKGLPVGLPASAVVANLALVELDRLLVQQAAPLYYGRYVDDILLVMENGADFKSAAQLWEWLFKRSGGLLYWKVACETTSIQFKPAYLEGSSICFDNSKNKVFLLEGESGQTLVESIDQQIHQRASEWRSLPDLPASPMQVATALASATQSDGDVADNLRKTSAMSMKRAGFALKLRDFEAYERDLPPAAWQAHRHAFLKAFIEHVLEPRMFFDLATYLPRVVRLATACEDYALLAQLIERLKKLKGLITDHCTVEIKSELECIADDKAKRIGIWWDKLMSSVSESIMAAFPGAPARAVKRQWQALIDKLDPAMPLFGTLIGGVPAYEQQHARLFACDLAHMPYRFRHLPREMISQRGIPKTDTALSAEPLESWLPVEVMPGLHTLGRWCHCKVSVPMGFAYATRPFGLAELFLLGDASIFTAEGQPELNSVVKALRGFQPEGEMPQMDAKRLLTVADSKASLKPTIAVSSWKTEMESWVAAVRSESDPDATRYGRMTRLINEVISRPHGARYLILPELAMPARWFMRVAQKLKGKGISLITGVEYLHARRKRVHNQVWISLTHDGLGFPSLMVYRQDKQRPALHEEQELFELRGLKMQPFKRWSPDEPPVIDHGGLRFALLVCSELTNIQYRAALRGKVDVLFVPEWNKDTETYNALVESAALDMHAYIVQCNDRSYGDSRIRVPHKDSWQRDVLRVKGGKDDYWVTGEIDAAALREFQSNHRSPAKPFKPMPDGFEMEHGRAVDGGSR